MPRRLERVAAGIMVDGVQVAETLQCCHCGMHWDREPGSGRTRGFCLKCNGVLCGQQRCIEECKPFEKWLDEVEADAIANMWRHEKMIEEYAAAGGVIL